MYLSKLILNPRSYEVRRDLARHQDLHHTVLSLFPQVPPDVSNPDARQHFGVLFRLDTDSHSGRITLLIQSRVTPDFTPLPANYAAGTPGTSGTAATCKPIDEAYGALQGGTRLAFRLRANPTRKIDTKTGPDGKKRNGRRVDLRGEQEWWAWLRRKGETGGFRLLAIRSASGDRISPHTASASSLPLEVVPNVRATSEARNYPRRSNQPRLTFASVLFEGILEVTDPTAFLASLEQGLGSAKAYGFGLLSVAPAAPAPVGT
jgi:CRISPR system Cascade subunit CasE